MWGRTSGYLGKYFLKQKTRDGSAPKMRLHQKKESEMAGEINGCVSSLEGLQIFVWNLLNVVIRKACLALWGELVQSTGRELPTC